MRKSLKLFPIPILLLILSIFSCNKEDAVVIQKDNLLVNTREAISSFDNFPTVRNGRLHFESVESAEWYITNLRDTDSHYYPESTLNTWGGHYRIL